MKKLTWSDSENRWKSLRKHPQKISRTVSIFGTKAYAEYPRLARIQPSGLIKPLVLFVAVDKEEKLKLRKAIPISRWHLITDLTVSSYTLEYIYLPKRLQTLNLGHNKLKALPKFPKTLETLQMVGNVMTEVDLSKTRLKQVIFSDSWCVLRLPKTLRILMLEDAAIPVFPEHLQVLDIQKCDVLNITLPNFLEVLDISDCNELNTNVTAFPKTLRTLRLCNIEVYSLEDLPQTLERLEVVVCGLMRIELPETVNLVFLKLTGGGLRECPTFPASLVTIDLSENNLQTLSTLPPGLVRLTADNNELIEVPEIPSNVEYLHLKNNRLQNLSWAPHSMLRVLDISGNAFERLPRLPNSLVNLAAKNNHITKIKRFPGRLEVINLNDNDLKTIPALPKRLLILKVARNQLVVLPKLSRRLIDLHACHNKLKNLPKLPPRLCEMYVQHNKLKKLPLPPDSLLYLRVSGNKIKNLGPLSPNLRELVVCDTKLSVIPKLPKTIGKFNARGCHITTITGIWMRKFLRFDVQDNPIERIERPPPNVKINHKWKKTLFRYGETYFEAYDDWCLMQHRKNFEPSLVTIISVPLPGVERCPTRIEEIEEDKTLPLSLSGPLPLPHSLPLECNPLVTKAGVIVVPTKDPRVGPGKVGRIFWRYETTGEH